MRPNFLVFFALAAAVSCVPDTPAECLNNGDCDVGQVCLDAACVTVTDNPDEGEGEGDEGEGEGDIGEGEGEGEGDGAVCGNGVVEGDEGCDDGEFGGVDDALDGCAACAVTAADVEFVVGKGGVDTVNDVRFVASAGDDLALVTADAVFVGDLDDGFVRAAARGDIDDVTRCGDRLFFADAANRQVFTDAPFELAAFAGNGNAETATTDPPGLDFGVDPLLVPMTPTSVACDLAGRLLIATAEGRVLRLDDDGHLRGLVGKRSNDVQATDAQNLKLAAVHAVAVDPVSGDALVALEDATSERFVRVIASGEVAPIAGGGAVDVFDNLDAEIVATEADLFQIDDIESDGADGFWLVHFAHDVWHVDNTGAMRRVGRTISPVAESGVAGHVAVVDGDAVFPARGGFVRVTPAETSTRFGTPRPFPIDFAAADHDGVVVANFAAGGFGVDDDGVVSAIDADVAADDLVFAVFRSTTRTSVFRGLDLDVVDDAGNVVAFPGVGEVVRSVAESPLTPDVLYVATDNCKIFRIDVAGAAPAQQFPSMSGCTFSPGDPLGESTFDPVAVTVVAGRLIANQRKDLLIAIDVTGHVVSAGIDVDADGPVNVIAGGGSDVGDGVDALDADLGDPTAIAALPNGSFVIATNDQLRVFTRGGTITTVAENVGAPLAIVVVDDDNVTVVNRDDVRAVSLADGSVRVVQRNEVNRFTQPRHVACRSGDDCAVSDDDSLKRVVAGAVTTLFASENLVTGVTVDDDGEFVVSDLHGDDDDALLRVFNDGSTAVAAQPGPFVNGPGALACSDDGSFIFVSSAGGQSTLARVGSPTGTFFSGHPDIFGDVDVSGDSAVFSVGLNGDVRVFDHTSLFPFFTETTALGIDDAGSVALDGDILAFADGEGVKVVQLVDGPLAPRLALADPSRCVRDLEVVDDVIVAVDGCTGALVRITYR